MKLIAGENLCADSQVRLGWNEYLQLSVAFKKRKCLYFSEAVNGISTSESYTNDIKTDCQGNIYITGEFSGTLTLSGLNPLVSVGAADLFVAKLNPALGWIAATSAGGTGTAATGYSLAIDCLNNVYVVGGYYAGSLQFGSSITLPTNTSGFSNIFVAKLDPSFTWTQATYAGGSDQDSVAHGVTIDSNDVYVTGECSGSAMFGLLSVGLIPGNIYTFVGKLSPTLNWTNLATGGEGSAGYGIVINCCQNIVITGTLSLTATFGSTVLSTNLTSNIYVAKLDTALNWIYAVAPTGTIDEVSSIGVNLNLVTNDQEGNIYICGTFSGTIIFNCFYINSLNNSGINTNGFVIKLDSNLNWIKASTIILGDLSSLIYDVALANDYLGNIYVSGPYNGNIEFDNIRLKNFGSNTNVFVAKADSSLNWISAINTGGGGSQSEIVPIPTVTADYSGNIYITPTFIGSIPFGQTILNSSVVTFAVVQVRDDECSISGTIACSALRGQYVDVKFDNAYICTSQVLIPSFYYGVTKHGKIIPLCPLTLCYINCFIFIGIAVTSNILLLKSQQ